jgi:hypothetical protein
MVTASDSPEVTALAAINTKTPALGQALAAASVPVVLTAAEQAQLGAVTETAPANDTASSGLNGRLQRLAQRITSLIALFPSSIGRKANADSLSVTLSSDHAAVPVSHAPRASRSRQVTTITGTTETTIVTAGATGVLRDVFLLLVSNTSATATNVTIRDATAGTTVFVFAVPAGQTVGYSMAACDAVKQTTAANNWTAQLSTGVTSIVITAAYVEN